MSPKKNPDGKKHPGEVTEAMRRMHQETARKHLAFLSEAEQRQLRYLMTNGRRPN